MCLRDYIRKIDFKKNLVYNTQKNNYGEFMNMKKLSIVALIALFGVFAFNNFAMAQDDMQEAKASFFGAGVKYQMDKPSFRVRATENTESGKVKEAINYDVMKGGLLNEALYGPEDGQTGTPLRAGGKRRGVKDTTLLCETCKAKAIIHSSENCEYCKGKAYGELCDKCIAWSILNACDDCRMKITGAVKKDSPAKETEKKEIADMPAETATDEAIKEDKKIEEITADDEDAVKTVKKAKKKTSKKKSTKKAAKKAVKEAAETEPAVK